MIRWNSSSGLFKHNLGTEGANADYAAHDVKDLEATPAEPMLKPIW